MQLENSCPCCKEKITFKEMFKLWSIYSKTEDKLMYCQFCNNEIGNLSDYERYGLFGSLPLFAMPIVYDDSVTAYIMAGIILFYIIFLFYFLYRLVPLKCLGHDKFNIEREVKKSTDEKNNLFAVLIITIIFFISIFAVFSPLFHK